VEDRASYDPMRGARGHFTFYSDLLTVFPDREFPRGSHPNQDKNILCFEQRV